MGEQSYLCIEPQLFVERVDANICTEMSTASSYFQGMAMLLKKQSGFKPIALEARVQIPPSKKFKFNGIILKLLKGNYLLHTMMPLE